MKHQVDQDRIKSWFAGHRVSPRKSISWHMASRDEDGRYQSNYAYSVTWTPGTLCIAGDLGEFTVTHYQAMKTIECTLSWLDNISFSYLMEKSTSKLEFDQDGTVEDIIRAANEGAVDCLKMMRKERQQFRSDCAQAKVDWEKEREAWENEPRRERGALGAPPVLDDFLPDDGGLFKLEMGTRYDRPVAPDGWELWYALWKEVDSYGDPSAIFTPNGRYFIKRELEGRVGDPRDAADLCRRIGLDDYYGRYEYPHQCHVWAIAIQTWVDQVKAGRCEAQIPGETG